MLDIRFIRENKEAVKKSVNDRGFSVDVDRLLKVDEDRRRLIQAIEQLQAQRNKATEEIAAQGASREADKIAQMRLVKQQIDQMQQELEKIEQEFNSLLLALPNMMQPGTPVGKSEADNVVVREVGKKRKFNFRPRDYMEIGKDLDLIDVERAGKVSGSRFGYLKNEAAMLEFALVRLALDVLSKENFKPIVPPVMVRPESLQGMGYIDSEPEREERYYFEKDNLYLVGTSEQSIGPMHMGEVLDESQLPLRYAGFSSCFRREAGSYGKDTKGILRVHQFDKIEMFSFCRPEDSVKEHELIISMEEKLMRKLELPYRLMRLCSVDFAKPSSATYDIETWLPGQNNGQGQYRETHSSSNCTDFQTRRLNIRYKNPTTGKAEYVHALNGTAFAIGRIIIAILENYQQSDGSVEVPKVLRDFCGFKKIQAKK